MTERLQRDMQTFVINQTANSQPERASMLPLKSTAAFPGLRAWIQIRSRIDAKGKVANLVRKTLQERRSWSIHWRCANDGSRLPKNHVFERPLQEPQNLLTNHITVVGNN